MILLQERTQRTSRPFRVEAADVDLGIVSMDRPIPVSVEVFLEGRTAAAGDESPPPATLHNGGGIEIHPSPETPDALRSARRISERIEVRPGESVVVNARPTVSLVDSGAAPALLPSGRSA